MRSSRQGSRIRPSSPGSISPRLTRSPNGRSGDGIEAGVDGHAGLVRERVLLEQGLEPVRERGRVPRRELHDDADAVLGPEGDRVELDDRVREVDVVVALHGPGDGVGEGPGRAGLGGVGVVDPDQDPAAERHPDRRAGPLPTAARIGLGPGEPAGPAPRAGRADAAAAEPDVRDRELVAGPFDPGDAGRKARALEREVDGPLGEEVADGRTDAAGLADERALPVMVTRPHRAAEAVVELHELDLVRPLARDRDEPAVRHRVRIRDARHRAPPPPSPRRPRAARRARRSAPCPGSGR